MADYRNSPKLEYIDVGVRPEPYDFDYLTPIVPCPRCRRRFVQDPNRYGDGSPVRGHSWDAESEPPMCDQCRGKVFSEAFEADVLSTIESKLGLTEKDRDALKDFIQTVFTDPKKILKVQELDNRVSGLQTQVTNLWVAFGLLAALLAVILGVFTATIVQ